jgi:hypothetical protein
MDPIRDHHGIDFRGVPKVFFESKEPLLCFRRKPVVRIEPKNPSARAVLERSVPGSCEIIYPLELEHLGAVLCGDRPGLIGGSRVDDNEFVTYDSGLI